MRRALVGTATAAWLFIMGTVAQAQTGGVGTGTSGLGSGTTGGVSTGGVTAGTAGMSTGIGSGIGTSGTSGTSFQLQQMMQAPTISAPSTTTGTSTGVSSSNFLAPYFSNVLYQGSAQNNRSTGGNNGAPGGFGQPTFGTNGGAGGGSIGFAGSLGGTRGGGAGAMGSTRGGSTGSSRGGALGGMAGFGGAGGFGGLGSTNLQSGVVIPHQTGNSYMMVARFPAQTTSAPQLQQQVQTLLQRSASISNPGGIQAIVSGHTVILRGSAADEDEARRIANMISLTPGVREVRNELTYPRLPVLDR
ncbi:MAG: BON domain-containing protein [Thermogemmata sp.]|nr:BON domain-containing protein [Thermogemmata sp.]